MIGLMFRLNSVDRTVHADQLHLSGERGWSAVRRVNAASAPSAASAAASLTHGDPIARLATGPKQTNFYSWRIWEQKDS